MSQFPTTQPAKGSFPIRRARMAPPTVGPSVPASLDTETGEGAAAAGITRAGAGIAQFGMQALAKLKEASDAVELSSLQKKADEMRNAALLEVSKAPDEESARAVMEKLQSDTEELAETASNETVARGYQLYHDRQKPRYVATAEQAILKRRVANLQAEAELNTHDLLAKGDIEGAIELQRKLMEAGALAKPRFDHFAKHAPFLGALAQASAVAPTDPIMARRQTMIVPAAPGYQLKYKTSVINQIDENIANQDQSKKLRAKDQQIDMYKGVMQGVMPDPKNYPDVSPAEILSVQWSLHNRNRQLSQEVDQQNELDALNWIIEKKTGGENITRGDVAGSNLKYLSPEYKGRLLQGIDQQEEIDLTVDKKALQQVQIMAIQDFEVRRGVILAEAQREAEKEEDPQKAEAIMQEARDLTTLTLAKVRMLGADLDPMSHEAYVEQYKLRRSLEMREFFTAEGRMERVTKALVDERRRQNTNRLLADTYMGDPPWRDEVTAMMKRGELTHEQAAKIMGEIEAFEKPPTLAGDIQYRVWLKHVTVMFKEGTLGKQTYPQTRARYDELLLVIRTAFSDESLSADEKIKRIESAIKKNSPGFGTRVKERVGIE